MFLISEAMDDVYFIWSIYVVSLIIHLLKNQEKVFFFLFQKTGCLWREFYRKLLVSKCAFISFLFCFSKQNSFSSKQRNSLTY